MFSTEELGSSLESCKIELFNFIWPLPVPTMQAEISWSP